MSLIFLDIDGVMNNMTWLRQQWDAGIDPSRLRRELLDPASIAVLNEIVVTTKAEVVISSSWRYGRKLEDMQIILEKNGFTGQVIGMTSTNHEGVAKTLGMWGERIQRGHEIQAWLKLWYKNDPYVVIDDSGDMAGVEDHLVLLNHDTGLQKEHIPLVLEKLK